MTGEAHGLQRILDGIPERPCASDPLDPRGAGNTDHRLAGGGGAARRCAPRLERRRAEPADRILAAPQARSRARRRGRSVLVRDPDYAGRRIQRAVAAHGFRVHPADGGPGARLPAAGAGGPAARADRLEHRHAEPGPREPGAGGNSPRRQAVGAGRHGADEQERRRGAVLARAADVPAGHRRRAGARWNPAAAAADDGRTAARAAQHLRSGRDCAGRLAGCRHPEGVDPHRADCSRCREVRRTRRTVGQHPAGEHRRHAGVHHRFLPGADRRLRGGRHRGDRGSGDRHAATVHGRGPFDRRGGLDPAAHVPGGAGRRRPRDATPRGGRARPVAGGARAAEPARRPRATLAHRGTSGAVLRDAVRRHRGCEQARAHAGRRRRTHVRAVRR